MGAQKKKKTTTDEVAAARCKMTVEQWRAVKAQSAAARGRGRRPTGTAGAEAKLGDWSAVADQMPLFPVNRHGRTVL